MSSMTRKPFPSLPSPSSHSTKDPFQALKLLDGLEELTRRSLTEVRLAQEAERTQAVAARASKPSSPLPSPAPQAAALPPVETSKQEYAPALKDPALVEALLRLRQAAQSRAAALAPTPAPKVNAPSAPADHSPSASPAVPTRGFNPPAPAPSIQVTFKSQHQMRRSSTITQPILQPLRPERPGEPG